MDICELYTRLRQYEGDKFYTITGLPFTYTIDNGGTIRVSRTKQAINRSNFIKALKLMPLSGPGEINDIVIGSAYVYAMITDKRINKF